MYQFINHPNEETRLKNMTHKKHQIYNAQFHYGCKAESNRVMGILGSVEKYRTAHFKMGTLAEIVPFYSACGR
jgi:hypothetical protein